MLLLRTTTLPCLQATLGLSSRDCGTYEVCKINYAVAGSPLPSHPVASNTRLGKPFDMLWPRKTEHEFKDNHVRLPTCGVWARRALFARAHKRVSRTLLFEIMSRNHHKIHDLTGLSELPTHFQQRGVQHCPARPICLPARCPRDNQDTLENPAFLRFHPLYNLLYACTEDITKANEVSLWGCRKRSWAVCW